VPIARSVTITVRITAVHGHVVLVRPAAHHEAPEQRPEAEAHAKLRGFLAGGEGGLRLDIGRNDGLDDETQKPVDEQASAKRREHRGEGADMAIPDPGPWPVLPELRGNDHDHDRAIHPSQRIHKLQRRVPR
jgi:hypothetical protein